MWWQTQREQLLALHEQTPCYVYALAQVRAAALRVMQLPVDKVFFASKANHHPAILRALYEAGVGIECVSPGEVEHTRQCLPQIDKGRLLFTPNFAPRREYAWAAQQDFFLTLDSLYPLQNWPELFRDREVLLRFDPGAGAGHHEHVKTGGDEAKFGIRLADAQLAAQLADAAGAHIVGVHAHAGSGIMETEHWSTLMAILAQLLPLFPEARIVNIGGGFGVPEYLHHASLDMALVSASLSKMRSRFPQLELWIEPGRYLVADAGVILTRVTQTKGKGEHAYVGVDVGMNSLIRPALYNAHHPIVNLSRINETAQQTVTVVGPICESADKLAVDISLPACQEDDVLLLANTGAYGRVMSSHYNLREPAQEIVIE